ncbi:hypothetical protein PTKIN_Ptkin13bG0287100 [Pterospermum kingtungense]
MSKLLAPFSVSSLRFYRKFGFFLAFTSLGPFENLFFSSFGLSWIKTRSQFLFFFGSFWLSENAMAELGRLLIYEASRDWLPTVTGEIQSPMAIASVEFVDPREPVVIVPILRAGLALAEHASSILPATKIYHLGLSRDEETLLPTVYLNKLPDKFPEGSRVFVVDPMLATGGTIVAALNLLKERGIRNKQMRVISALAAPPALQKLSERFSG